MALLLSSGHLHSGSQQKNSVCEVLYAASWIVGEFSSSLSDPLSALEALLQPRVAALPGESSFP
jgi:AP-3 complex subunit delta-1